LPEPEQIFARNPAEWRAWLDEHHTTASEVWLVYFKKASGKESIAWAAAVEMALRYGWIDGLIRGIDDERYMQRFTPRRPKSKWSKVNKEIVERMLEAGELTPMGIAAVEAAKASGEWDRAYTVQRPTPPPVDLKEAIRRSPDAKRGRDRMSRTRWDRWMAWLEKSEGRTRTRRINAIVKALETRENASVDAQVQRST
jgi:uncharacterized protein YdeI (YjbR/CyaY-like superfamily)